MANSNQPFCFASTVRAAFAVSMLFSLIVLLPAAHAQIFVSPRSPIVTTSPEVAAPGVPRTVTIRSVSGCKPDAVVVGGTNTRTRTISIRLNISNAIQCDLLVSQESTVQVTPDAEGDLRVLVVSSLGGYIGEGNIRTRAPLGNRSQIDLSGMWYDPATLGSGLTFMHASTGSDQVFGTWYVYDNQGNPRWFTIQGVQWGVGGNEALGRLYETGASSVVCLPPLTGCPVAAATVGQSGIVRIQIDGPNSARIFAYSSNGGATLSSNLVRSVF